MVDILHKLSCHILGKNRKLPSRPSSSKLTMLLVNISLKLCSLNMTYMLIFLLKKCDLEKLISLFSKNTYELDIVLIRAVNILTTNKLVKLTML